MNESRILQLFASLAMVLLMLLHIPTAHAAGPAFSNATFKGRPSGCGEGTFFDPRNGGECWSFPDDYNRTLLPVTDTKACAKPSHGKLKAAKKIRKNSSIGQGCKKGNFWDVKGGDGLLGACYSCKGFKRSDLVRAR